MNSLSLPRRRWRGLVAAAATVGVVATSFGLLQSADAASSKVRIAVTDPVVGGDRAVSVRLTCGTAAACRGTVKLKAAAKASKTNAGITTGAVSFSLKKKASRVITVRLSTAQRAALTKAGRARVTVVLTQKGKRGTSATARTTLRPATASLRIGTRTAQVAANRQVSLAVSCAASVTCRGSVLPVLGTAGSAKSFSVAAGRSASLVVPLSVAQAAAVTKAGTKGATVAFKVTESAPEKVGATAYISISTKPVPNTDVYSVAYTLREWKPTQYDTCSKELHNPYSVTGPDGKIYPSWHPAEVTDPATGKTCTFGHEHGSDPKSSDIYDWVATYLDNGQKSPRKGIPFGYVSERLEDFGKIHAGMTMRHEDNGGHKVHVANNVALLDANRDWVRDSAGNKVVCDYLIKAHQGSWSPDATSNNAHELIYAVKCTDGTEIISSTLSMYGNSNEFEKVCENNAVVTTKFSTLPKGYGGGRILPDSTCVDANVKGSAKATFWDIYELWSSENRLTTADGTVLAAFDPWFGVRNPSRYYDASKSTTTANGVSRTVDLAWGPDASTGFPWNTVSSVEKFDYQDPRSPFDGAQRDFYLNQTSVKTTGTYFTTPYGDDAAATAFDGSVKQLLKAGTASNVALSTQKFGGSQDFGNNNGVHAPN